MIVAYERLPLPKLAALEGDNLGIEVAFCCCTLENVERWFLWVICQRGRCRPADEDANA